MAPLGLGLRRKVVVVGSLRKKEFSSESANWQEDLPASSRYVQASAWAGYLPDLFEPKQFVTVTFKEETSLNSVLRRHGYIIQQVNRHLFGNNWRRHGEGVSYLLGVEPQLRGVLHAHAVWDVRYVPYDLVHTIDDGIGGHVHIEPVGSSCGVGYYVTKYAVKSGAVYIWLSRAIEALRN